MTENEVNASAIDHYNKGRAKHNLGQYEAAIVDYNAAIRLKPDFLLAYNNRGLAKYYLSQYDAAIADYDTAIQLEPKFAGAYSNRGLAKYYLGQYNAAIADCDKAIWFEPELAEAFHNRGFAKVELGQYNSAIADYDNAIQLEPDDAKTYYNRGLVKAKLNQYDAAITDYDTAVRLEPKDAKVYYNRGNAKVKLGQHDEAIIDYDTAIRLKPDYIEAHNNRGMAKYDTGQYDDAITAQNIVIRLKPDYAPAYYNRGLAKEQLGQTREAEQDWQTALKLATQTGNVELKNHIESELRHTEDQVKASDFATDHYNQRRARAKLSQTCEAKALQMPLNTLTPEQIDLLSNVINIAIEDAIDVLSQKTLDDFQQEVLAALQAYFDNPGTLTTEQDVLLKDFVDITVEDELANLTQKDTLTDSEQELLAALQVYESTSQTSPASGITQETETDPESKDAPNTTSAQEKPVHYSEDQIKEIVADYFESLRTATPGYSVKREYLIQMGSDQRRADVVFLRNGKLVAIVECKETGRVRKGIDQLKSYLCATDTFLGIFANDGDPDKWTFWENHRHNNFLEIDRITFESYVYNHDKTIKDREKKIKVEVQRDIDAEIRERVRKNTDTDAVRQNETDRIKREITENIDKRAVINSVRSQIAEQAKSGLLKERDKENRKLGRAQGFWWTIFGIVGIGILIAMLITSG